MKKTMKLIAAVAACMLFVFAAVGGSSSSSESSSAASSSFSSVSEPKQAAVDTNPHYVLVIGDDTWEDNKPGRADLMMLMRLDFDKHQVTLVSVPRDTKYVDADGNIIIDQMTDSPYAAALTAIRASWPEPENETELLYFRDKNGTLHFFLAGGCTFWENGQSQARLYTFLNLEDYYDMAVDGMYFLFLLCAVCIMLAAGGGYYMAAKNIKPLEILFAREHEFAADASHELRTPVTVIRGSLEALNDKVVTDKEEVEQYYRQMLKESLFLQERFWEAVLKVCMIYLITADIQIPFLYAKNTIFSLV